MEREREEALQKLNESLSVFDEQKSDLKDELERLRDEAYQVVSWYAVFQGVIFTAVSHGDQLSCKLSWSPVSLSIAVSVATLLAIVNKLFRIRDVQEELEKTDRSLNATLDLMDKVELSGCEGLGSERPRWSDPASYYDSGSIFLAICVLAFLAIFSVLIAWLCIKAISPHCASCPSKKVALLNSTN